MATAKNEYVPGVCNIGREEVRKRIAIGWGGAIVTALLFVAFAFTPVAPLARAAVFFPALLSAIGFLQAAWGFCVRFGLSGAFNFDPDLSRTDSVEQAEHRREDRRTSFKIIALAVLTAAATAVLAYCLPY